MHAARAERAQPDRHESTPRRRDSLHDDRSRFTQRRLLDRRSRAYFLKFDLRRRLRLGGRLEVRIFLEAEHLRGDVDGEACGAACCIPECARCSACARRRAGSRCPASSSIRRLNCSFGLEVADSSRRPPAAGRARTSAGSPPGWFPRRLRREQPRSRVGDVLEDAFFVRGVALHRLDQVRDQIVAALDLVLHLRPLRLDRLFLRRELVVRAARTAPIATKAITACTCSDVLRIAHHPHCPQLSA